MEIFYYRAVSTPTGDELRSALSDVERLYRHVKIDITFRDKGEIDDPIHSFRGTFEDLIPRWRAEGGAGRLVFGSTTLKGSKVAGELVDLDTRGVAAVYCESERLGGMGEALLAETIAHEIGHMFDLPHDDAGVNGFFSVMTVAKARKKPYENAWKLAASKVKRAEKFYPPLPLPQCYPFSATARSHLKRLEVKNLPWGGAYTHDYDVVTE